MSNLIEQEGESPLPTRLPGEPSNRCFWCLKFRATARLQLCQECRDWLEEQRKEMPKSTKASKNEQKVRLKRCKIVLGDKRKQS